LKSKSFTVVKSGESAAIYRPSGDQRGLNSPSDPGTVTVLCVFKSTIRIFKPSVSCTKYPNIMRVPSDDQLASIWFRLSGRISSALEPSGEITEIFNGLPGCMLAYAICFPSGDQCGNAARSGANVSWSFSLPSARDRHKVPSGTATYVTHLLSDEKSRSVAEIPEPKG